MKVSFPLGTLAGLLLATTGWAAADATAVADAVIAASGGQHWARVVAIQFTFNVSEGDKLLLAATHDWNVASGSDTVTWSGKTVTVDVRHPATDADSQAAYQRWVNDAYWLMMPLKLRDPGVHLTPRDRQDIDGRTYEVLHLSFGNVGLTSGDQYNLYIDPNTHLVRRWDYMPAPDKKVSGTWDDYRNFGGLKLSTDHQFGNKRIWFSDLKVERR